MIRLKTLVAMIVASALSIFLSVNENQKIYNQIVTARTEAIYQLVEKPSVDKEVKIIEQTKTEEEKPKYSVVGFKSAGVIDWNGWRWTWYSQRVLPGAELNIPGRQVINQLVCDEEGYICIASSDLIYGTVLDTPFGKGKVYDNGCELGTIDVYTDF